MQPSKEDCAKYIEGLPGASAYFGIDDHTGKPELECWAQGIHGSAELDTLYGWYVMGNFKDVQDWVSSHCQGNTIPATPGFSDSAKVEDIQAALDFFNADLSREQDAFSIAQSASPPDNGVIQTIGRNIGVLKNAIKYYGQLLVQAQQVEKGNTSAPEPSPN